MLTRKGSRPKGHGRISSRSGAPSGWGVTARSFVAKIFNHQRVRFVEISKTLPLCHMQDERKLGFCS